MEALRPVRPEVVTPRVGDGVAKPLSLLHSLARSLRIRSAARPRLEGFDHLTNAKITPLDLGGAISRITTKTLASCPAVMNTVRLSSCDRRLRWEISLPLRSLVRPLGARGNDYVGGAAANAGTAGFGRHLASASLERRWSRRDTRSWRARWCSVSDQFVGPVKDMLDDLDQSTTASCMPERDATRSQSDSSASKRSRNCSKSSPGSGRRWRHRRYSRMASRSLITSMQFGNSRRLSKYSINLGNGANGPGSPQRIYPINSGIAVTTSR